MESAKSFLCSCIHIIFPAQPFAVEAACEHWHALQYYAPLLQQTQGIYICQKGDYGIEIPQDLICQAWRT